MKFARIEMLFLIWAAPVLFLFFLYGMKRRASILSRFSSVRGLQSIAPDTGTGRRWIRAGLILAVVVLLAVTLSGPRYGYRWQEIERKGIDIMVALDCSGSMLAADIQPTRLDRAKREIYDLLAMLQGDRVGLTAFAGTAFLQCPMTMDYEAFHLFLNTLTPDFLPIGGTDISAAIQTATGGFDSKSNSEKAVILITDGENTGENDPVEAAQAAKEAGIKLFCIGVGKEDGVPVPDGKGGLRKDRDGKIIVTRLDEDLLKKIAVMTGGTYVRSVSGDMDLDRIYTQEIRGKMAQTALSSGRKQVWEDRFQWILGLAILLLMAEMLLPATRKTTLALIFMLIVLPLARPVYAGPMKDGLDAYNKGEYEKALKFFIDAQLDDPDNPRIRYNIGNTYYKMGDYENAARNFEAATKSEDKQLRQKSLYNLGNTDFRQEKFEDALKRYDEVLKNNPEDTETKQNAEFVKKVMAQKKQPPPDDKNQDKNKDKKDGEDQKDSDQDKSGGDKNQDKKDGKDQENPDQNESGDDKNQDGQKDQKDSDKGDFGDKDKKDASRPEFGDEKKDDENAVPQPSPGDRPEDQKDGKKAEAAQTGKPDDKKNSSEDKKQAERILNRLNDQPGRAMIPAYRERHVEKDW